MQKVISINLNGHAYQLEEGGYEALRAYLAGAERDLAANPDRAEIMADLEQAIADKCRAFLGAHKSVVTEAEVAQIVAEMGPVDATPGDPGSGPSPGAGETRTGTQEKRFYRITDGAMVGGVCNGIATYFSIDVTIVRVGFAITALLSQGFGILAYVVMMFVIPEAKTPEERAAAAGGPFNARDVVERARQQAVDGAKRAQVSWRRQQKQWRRQAAAGMPHISIRTPSPVAAGLAAMFTFFHLILFLIAAVAVVSLVNHEQAFGWRLDPDIPMWAALLILLIAYQIVVTPLRAAAAAPWAGQGGHSAWNATIWLVGLAFALWVASNHMPEVREFLVQAPELFRGFIADVRRMLEN
ncbi:MAG: PspC domain-containing protein [Acidobacteria bacterium]|nr:PspC domain-containing protein [Acidobacteriota bacterium]